MNTAPPVDLLNFVNASGLANVSEPARWTALTGGVSSEIWKVDLPGRSICVKRALQKLKVTEDWHAPMSRNAYEWRWLCFAAEHVPWAVPPLLGYDPEQGVIAMGYLEPQLYPVWKTHLLNGVVAPSVAAQVGALLASLHAASANRPALAERFDSLDNFIALRLEPYLLATARVHPDLGSQLEQLSDRTAATKVALVHGDVSPKNILVGPRGPVFLDAECAWYGDPGFDLAFCLNHLLLKTLVRRDSELALLESFSKLTEAYFDIAHFESRKTLEARTAELLPALLLSRIDGKSPVEYLVRDHQLRAFVRRLARAFLQSPVAHLATIAKEWQNNLRSNPFRASR